TYPAPAPTVAPTTTLAPSFSQWGTWKPNPPWRSAASAAVSSVNSVCPVLKFIELNMTVSPNDVGSPLKAIRLTASFQPSLCRAAPQRNGAQPALFYDFLPDTSLSSCRMGSKSCLILSLPCPCCDPAEVGAHKCAPSEQIVTTD